MQALLDLSFFPADVSPWIANLSILFIKGIFVLGATWLMAYALKGSAAAIRYMVWCTGLLSLMMLPLLSSILPSWQLDVLPQITASQEAVLPPADVIVVPAPVVWDEDIVVQAPAPAEEIAGAVVANTSASTSFFSSIFLQNYHWTTWTFIIWVLGVFIALVRLLLAHAGAAMLIRKSEIVHDEDWHLLSERICRRLEIEHFVRLRKSAWTSVPMSVGIWRSTIVLPENADEWDENQRQTVLYHELAHVKRKDCLFHLLTQITCALHWFNPLVWVAAWQLRIERERACDDLVVTSGIDPSQYAETLLQTARQIKKAEWSTLATVSMARQSQLEGRLLSILDPMRRRNLNKASVAITVFMIACVVVPLSIMQPASAQKAPPPPPAWDIVEFPHVPEFVIPEIHIPKIVVPEIDIPEIYVPEIHVPEFVVPDIHVPEIHVPEIHVPEFVMPDIDVDFPGGRHVFVDVDPVVAPGALWHPVGERNIDQTPIDSLSIEQIIQLRKYGVDAEFIQDMRALGFNNLTYNDLVRAGKYGASPSYIRGMQSAGYSGLSLSDYAGMSKYGVSAEFVGAMSASGYTDLSAEELISMSKYGVDTRLVATLENYGYDDITIEELVAASKYGVSQGLIETLDAAGYRNLSVDALVGMSKYGVSNQLIETLARYGYDNVSSDELISASKYGVSNELIEALAEAGYNNFSLNEVISASKYGVSRRLIAGLRTYGYEDMDADEMIAASKYGVSERLLQSLAEAGYDGIPLKDVISMSKYGVNGRYLIEMKETGVEMDVEDIIRLRKYGVDASYINTMRNAAAEDLSVEQLIDMHKHGVDADFIRSLRDNN